MKVFFGYVDYTSDDKAFYVGIGNLSRVLCKKRNRKHSVVSLRFGQHRVVELECNSWTIAKAWEIGAIAAYTTFTTEYSTCDGTNLCCNFTRGGDGTVGRIVSVQAKQLQSKKMQGNKNSLGFRHSSQTLVQMQQSQIKRYENPQERQKISDLNNERWRKIHKGERKLSKKQLKAQELFAQNRRGKKDSQTARRNKSLSKIGKPCPWVKKKRVLTVSDGAEIKSLRLLGVSLKELELRFNVSGSTIRRVLCNELKYKEDEK